MTGTGLFARDGGEFVGNTTTAGDQNTPIVAALAAGGFVMAWNDAGSGHGVVAQLFDSAGHKLGGETVLGTATASGATLHRRQRAFIFRRRSDDRCRSADTLTNCLSASMAGYDFSAAKYHL